MAISVTQTTKANRTHTLYLLEGRAVTDRLEQIRRYIEENKRVEVVEISRHFNVSVATARRKLDQLAEIGGIERIHGGARLVREAPPEPPVLLRRNDLIDEKMRIAKVAAALINDGDTVLMGGGTTVYEVAKKLNEKSGITVITNSFLVIEALSTNRDIHLITLGGVFRNTEMVSYGHITEEALNELYASKVIFGIRAISLEHGLTNDYPPELTTDRMILRKGKEIIVVADHTKFNRVSTSLIGELSLAHKIVTDDKAPPETIKAIQMLGIEVIIA